jgi:hypothetical protein
VPVLPPLPDAPLLLLAPLLPPVPVAAPPPPATLPPADPPPPGPPPAVPVTGLLVSGATPWYWAWELDCAIVAAGTARANDVTRRGTQIRLLMDEL